MTPCDFWTSQRLDKRITRDDFAKVLPACNIKLEAAGCTWLRQSRINFETHDMIWVEGWLEQQVDTAPFDASALAADKAV